MVGMLCVRPHPSALTQIDGSKMSVVQMMRPMSERPPAGVRITVFIQDDQQLECTTCLVTSTDGSGVVIYHGRQSIDESKARGWLARGKVWSDSRMDGKE